MNLHFTLCLQHQDFVIINKPSGISVHKDQQAVGFTELVAKQLGVAQVWLVHRLDKITSGLLILALNKQHKIQKTYWAISDKKPKKKQGKIVGDMQKSRNGAWKLCYSKENPAITQFTSCPIDPPLRHFILQPKTGKTHQLRVAMKSLGSPILGDNLYSGNQSDRVYLHAYQLEFDCQNEHFCVQALPESGQIWQKVCKLEAEK